MNSIPLFMLAAFLGAVSGCAGFVWFYNRALSRMHEVPLKKFLALGTLPIGCLLGIAGGARMAWGNPRGAEFLFWLLWCAIGGLITARYAVVAAQRRRLEADSQYEWARPPIDGINWRYLAGWRAALLRALQPINQVTRLRIHTREVRLKGLAPEFHGYRILHLTDFHIHPTLTDDWYRRLLKESLRLQPDIILYGGDFISKQPYINRIQPVMRHLRAPDGVWFVRGNHDFWRGPNRITKLAQRADMRLLSNEGLVLRRGDATLTIVGLEMPYLTVSPREHDALRALPHPRIGLVHTPEAYPDALTYGCQLALAGHTHGGQVRLPLFGTTISAAPVHPLLASGVGKLKEMLTITSNGGGAFFPLRTLCPPEIVLIKLLSEPQRAQSEKGRSQRI